MFFALSIRDDGGIIKFYFNAAKLINAQRHAIAEKLIVLHNIFTCRCHFCCFHDCRKALLYFHARSSSYFFALNCYI